MKNAVLITLGSNIDRQRNLPRAIVALSRRPALDVVAVSRIYEFQPVGGSGEQEPFYNAAALLETDLDPIELRRTLREMEVQLGRVRTADKYASRPIDLDIAMIGERILDVDGHHLPEPEIVLYPHLALPLADIAPDWVHPEQQRTLGQIAENLDHSPKEIYPVENIKGSLKN